MIIGVSVLGFRIFFSFEVIYFLYFRGEIEVEKVIVFYFLVLGWNLLVECIGYRSLDFKLGIGFFWYFLVFGSVVAGVILV